MWPNPQETADLVVFTEKILNGNIHFLYNETLLLPIFLTKIFATNFKEFQRICNQIYCKILSFNT